VAFTTTSPFSSSTWNGPSGCAIISPSQWQAQVLDNINVLSEHNHSGSVGEGLSFSASVFPAIDNDIFSCFFPIQSLGAWARGYDTTFLYNGAIVPNGALNTCIAFPVYLRSGMYSLSILCQTASDAGTATATLWSGTASQSIGSLDFYSTPTAANQILSFTFTASGGGERLLILRLSSSNVGSNGYYAYLQAISINRTGD